MKKLTFYTEAAYVIGLLLLALGTALLTYGGFGMSMVVAPAYILHLYVSQFLPFFSFGMAEYVLQALVLVLMSVLLRRIKLSYFLSFVTAVLYGFALGGAMLLTVSFPDDVVLKAVAYAGGSVICCMAIAMLFSTYLPPEAYEMIVKEVSAKYNKSIQTVKLAYDIISLAISVVLSLVFFGGFKGIGVGTVVCAFAYGFIINAFQKLYNKVFRFKDGLRLRKYFEESEKSI